MSNKNTAEKAFLINVLPKSYSSVAKEEGARNRMDRGVVTDRAGASDHFDLVDHRTKFDLYSERRGTHGCASKHEGSVLF